MVIYDLKTSIKIVHYLYFQTLTFKKLDAVKRQIAKGAGLYKLKIYLELTFNTQIKEKYKRF